MLFRSQCFRDHGGLHIHTQIETRDGSRPYCVPSTEGIRIHDDVAHYEGEPIIHTDRWNAFTSHELDSMLQVNQITRLLICGSNSQAIEETVKAGIELGYSIWVCKDACPVNTPSFQELKNCEEWNVEFVITKLSAERYLSNHL